MARIVALARRQPDGGSALAAASLLTATLVGVGLAARIPIGVAVLLGALYLPLVFTNFPLAVSLWIPLVFLEGLPALNLAGKAAGLLLAAGWLGTMLRGSASRTVLARHRRLFEALALLVVWLTLSLAWAPNTGQAATAAWQWWAVTLVFLIVATSVTSAETLILSIGAYVAGAVLAVGLGTATGTLTSENGRLASSIGDPNFLAAALVSAIPLAFALSAVRSGHGWRLLCYGVAGVLAAGVVASQSRGGIAAALAMWAAAVVVLPRRRQVIAGGAVAVAAATVAFSLNPAAWDRITSRDSRGTGRVDLWTVAWKVFEDHPLAGVGVNSFGRVAGDYVRSVGPLEDVQLVVKTPDRAVHNTYLQFLAENGVPALALFLIVAAGCLATALRAARVFAALQRPDLVALAHALFVATIGLVASYVFLSGAVDRRLWILFGLSLATLGIAQRAAAERASAPLVTPPPWPGRDEPTWSRARP